MACLALAFSGAAHGQELPVVLGVDVQPVVSQALRIDEALAYLGSPLPVEASAAIEALADAAPSDDVVKAVQAALDPFCIAMVTISPEARVSVSGGPAEPRLIQDGWTTFLVKVNNQAGVRPELQVGGPNSEPALHHSSGAPNPKEDNLLTPGQVSQRFLELSLYARPPMTETLTGLELEYVILQAYTRQTGKREAQIGFHIGEGTQDIGFRNTTPVLFTIAPSVKVVLGVKDFDGKPTTAGFVIRDGIERVGKGDKPWSSDYRHSRAQMRSWEGLANNSNRLQGIYPLPARRVALTDEYPDFYFHPQVYRADGEHVYLPPGTYDVTVTRGPEYLPQERTITVPEGVTEHAESFALERWIHMAAKGWYSGDHHVHGGGCSHYESPEAGVQPHAMFRQALGEDLNVSCVLSWGPCWYHQKTFFEGDVHELSTDQYVMRYDVEVSGFPSQHAGHLCLLRLKEDDYPGTELIEEWPSWTMPILQWGQKQGGVVGYSHSGWGLEPVEKTDELPNYVMAKFDGIGANEYVVTAVHGACDFISAGDTPVTWELNIWYHTLNSGLTSRISGETDFPCIYDDRVGMARSYSPLGEKLDFDSFAESIKIGSNYVSDGLSHIYDFKADAVTMGAGESTLRLDGAKTVSFSAKVAAYLPAEQNEEGKAVQKANINRPPYWHIEKSRRGDTRDVAVELVVNGYPVASQIITADGKVNDVRFDYAVEASSWAAIRILPSSHTNPIFMEVGGKPIRASKRSAEWCRAAVDKCWEMKVKGIREAEQPAAKEAYDVARRYYDEAIAAATGE